MQMAMEQKPNGLIYICNIQYSHYRDWMCFLSPLCYSIEAVYKQLPGIKMMHKTFTLAKFKVKYNFLMLHFFKYLSVAYNH